LIGRNEVLGALVFGLVEVRPTEKGFDFLSDLQELFLAER